MYFKTLIVLVVLPSISYSKQLPSYIKQCSISASDFDECSLKNAKEALPTLLKGDKRYNIPNMLPLEISQVSLSTGPELNLELSDVKLYNLGNADLKSIKFDLKNRKITGDLYLDNLNLIGKYQINGKLVLIPIQGNGNINFTSVGTNVNYNANYELENKDGDDYIKITKSDVKVDLKRAYFHLTNLFNGNEELGTATNLVLNENWDQVMETLRPVITETIGTIGNSLFSGIFNHVPIKDIFAE